MTPEFRSEKRNDFLRRLTSYYTQFEGSPHFSFASDIYTGFGFDPATEPFDRNRAITNVEDAADISPRERDVFEQLAKGASTDEISGKLYISKATVKSHINSIYKKLGIHSHDDLLRAVDEEQRRLLGQAGR